jgi:hypothetical protein
MRSSLFALVAFVFCSQLVLGAEKKIAPPPPEVFSKVTAVNASTHEVTILFRKGDIVLAKKPTVYTIDDMTTVTVNGAPGKFSDIHAGMYVMGTTERDAHTLDNLTLQTTKPQDTQAGANN